MALDNRARMSTVCNWIPTFPASVRPTGGMSQLSRQAAAWMYAGVLAGVPEVVVTPSAEELVAIFERFRQRKNTKYQGKHFSI